MLLSLTLTASVLAASFLAPQDSATRCARAAADGTTLRAFFDADSPVVAELTAGTPLLVVEVREPWARVQVPGGLEVWVHGEYLSWKGSDGTLTRANVNARPLPNTEPPSTPLGRFVAGDAVVRVGRLGEWFRVRAPERISAWGPLASLTLLSEPPANWNEEWKRAAEARPAVREEPPAPTPVPAAEQKTGGGDSPVGKESGAGGAVAEPTEGAAAAAAAAAARPRAFPPAQIAKDPARWLSLAHQELAALRTALAAGFEGGSDGRVAELETTFATVLWHGSAAADLASARQGLASVDALRRSYGAWLAAGERRARAANDAAATAIWVERLDTLARSWGSDGEGGGLLTGWVEARPGVHQNLPYLVVRNGQSAVVHDFEDRWHFADFAGREVVVRGAWRADAELPGGRLFAVSEVRLLPTRP